MDEGCFVHAEIKKLLTETRAGIPLPIVGSTIRRTRIEKAKRAPATAVVLNVARSSEVKAGANVPPARLNAAPQLPVAHPPPYIPIVSDVLREAGEVIKAGVETATGQDGKKKD